MMKENNVHIKNTFDVAIPTEQVVELSTKLSEELEFNGRAIKRAFDFLSLLDKDKKIEVELHITKEKLGNIESGIDKFASKYDGEEVETYELVDGMQIETNSYEDKPIRGYVGISTSEKLIGRKKDKVKVVIAELFTKPDTLRYKIYININSLDGSKADGKLVDAIEQGLTESVAKLAKVNIESHLPINDEGWDSINEHKQKDNAVMLLITSVEQMYLNYVHTGDMMKFADDEPNMIISNANMAVVALAAGKWKLIGDNLYYTLSMISQLALSQVEYGENLDKVPKFDVMSVKTAMDNLRTTLRKVDTSLYFENKTDNSIDVQLLADLETNLDGLVVNKSKKGKKKKKK